MSKLYRSMYGRTAKPTVAAKPELTAEQRSKAASRVLGGMKIHGSHVKQVMIGEDLVDVPKVEYMQLLETQIREARARVKVMEDRYDRLLNHHNKAVSEINRIKAELLNMKKELDKKVSMRS